jgi:hypothetical protein
VAAVVMVAAVVALLAAKPDLKQLFSLLHQVIFSAILINYIHHQG